MTSHQQRRQASASLMTVHVSFVQSTNILKAAYFLKECPTVSMTDNLTVCPEWFAELQKDQYQDKEGTVYPKILNTHELER